MLTTFITLGVAFAAAAGLNYVTVEQDTSIEDDHMR